MYFAKHETFYIRDGWLTKGLQTIQDDPRIFLLNESPEILGLGKNMVRALRFWMQATGLTIEEYEGGKRIQTCTHLGKLILEYDPYLELDGTLWLLHHHLISNKEFATTWYWFFNHFVPVRFTKRDFITRLQEWIVLQPVIEREVSKNSLSKDFNCFVRTYLPSEKEKNPEDTIDCPLTALGLIASYVERDDEGNQHTAYQLETGNPSTIHPLVFLYVLLLNQKQKREGARQVDLQSVLRETRNVGRTFNIGVTAFEDLLGQLNDKYPDSRTHLTRTGGLDQLTLPDINADEVLNIFFEEQAMTTEEVRSWSRPLTN